jgi:hypothetical protein
MAGSQPTTGGARQQGPRRQGSLCAILCHHGDERAPCVASDDERALLVIHRLPRQPGQRRGYLCTAPPGAPPRARRPPPRRPGTSRPPHRCLAARRTAPSRHPAPAARSPAAPGGWAPPRPAPPAVAARAAPGKAQPGHRGAEYHYGGESRAGFGVTPFPSAGSWPRRRGGDAAVGESLGACMISLPGSGNETRGA